MVLRIAQVEILERPIIDLTWLDLTLAAGLILIAIGISRWHGLGLAKLLASKHWVFAAP